MPLTKCFNVTVDGCTPGSRTQTEKITWTNEGIKEAGMKQEEDCQNIAVKKCDSYNVTETVPTQVTTYENRTQTNPSCRIVPVREPSRTVTVTVNRPVTREVCTNIPVPICTQVPCATTGYCGQGTSPCQMNQRPVRVCPQPVTGIPNPDCQTVRLQIR